MPCPPIADLVALVETGPPAEADPVQRHAGDCDACCDVLAALREEVAAIGISLSRLWIQGRVSCPHASLLAGYAAGSLPPGAMDYLRFHLEDLGCPHCAAALEELAAEESGAATPQADRACRRVAESTAAWLAEPPGGGRGPRGR